MKIGYRISRLEDAALWDADLIQISSYKGGEDNIGRVKRCARACKEAGKRFVIHPVGHTLFDKDSFEEIKGLTGYADLAMILHDERTPENGRIEGDYRERFLAAYEEISLTTQISFENAVNTSDVGWFWDNFAESVTLDIGHVEAAGLDSIEFVRSLDEECLSKLEFVHIHRNNGLRKGITDHWPLIEGCRELTALRALLKRKWDISVILEIEHGDPEGSLNILREVKKEITE